MELGQREGGWEEPGGGDAVGGRSQEEGGVGVSGDRAVGGAGRAVGRARKRRRSQQVEGYEEEVGRRRESRSCCGRSPNPPVCFLTFGLERGGGARRPGAPAGGAVFVQFDCS